MRYKIQDRGKVRRSIGCKKWNLLRKLPLFIRGRIIRRLFSIDPDLPEGLVFKRAESANEIEQAFELAYYAYYERGLVAETRSQLRVMKFHALPTTTLLIAKQGDEVIATVSIIADSAMGLPIEKLFDIESVREQSVRIAEISTLAIKREYRARRGKLLLPLFIFLNHFCEKHLGIDTIVAAVHPEVQDFYRCVLLFNDIDHGKVKCHDFVQGAPAVASWLNLKTIPRRYKKAYGTKPSRRNAYYHFVVGEWPQFQFPKSVESSAEFRLTPRLLEYFFHHKSDVIETLTEKERKIIAEAYSQPEYSAVIGLVGLNNRDFSSHLNYSRPF